MATDKLILMDDNVTVDARGTLPNPEGVGELAAVTITMPGYYAHSLSHMLYSAAQVALIFGGNSDRFPAIEDNVRLGQALHEIAEQVVHEAVVCPGFDTLQLASK